MSNESQMIMELKDIRIAVQRTADATDAARRSVGGTDGNGLAGSRAPSNSPDATKPEYMLKFVEKFGTAMVRQTKTIKAHNELISRTGVTQRRRIRAINEQYKSGQITQLAGVHQLVELGASQDLLGKSSDELTQIFKATRKEAIRSRREVRKTDGAMAKSKAYTTKMIEDTANQNNKSGQALARVGVNLSMFTTKIDMILTSMQAAYEVADKSLTTGINVSANQFSDALMMGMDRNKLVDVLAEYRQEMEGSSQTTAEFQAMMRASSQEMFSFGAGLEGGALMAAEAARSYKMFAGDTANITDQTNFDDKQQEVYKSLYKSIGMTTEKFSEMTKGLDDSSDIQTAIFKLEKSKRANYRTDMLMAQKKYTMDGLTLQQAGALVSKLNQLSGQDGKSRLKQAAKTQAAFGAVGMAADGKRMFDLIRTGARGEGEQVEMKTLLEKFRERTGGMQQAGGGQEMIADAILTIAGLEDIMKSTEEAIMQRGNKVEEGISRNTTVLGEKIDFLGMSYSPADMMKAIEVIRTGVENPMTVVSGLLVTSMEGWVAISKGLNDLPTFFSDLSRNVLFGFDQLATIMSGVWSSISNFGSGLGSFFKWFGDSVIHGFKQALGALPGVKDHLAPAPRLKHYMNPSPKTNTVGLTHALDSVEVTTAKLAAKRLERDELVIKTNKQHLEASERQAAATAKLSDELTAIKLSITEQTTQQKTTAETLQEATENQTQALTSGLKPKTPFGAR